MDLRARNQGGTQDYLECKDALGLGIGRGCGASAYLTFLTVFQRGSLLQGVWPDFWETERQLDGL